MCSLSKSRNTISAQKSDDSSDNADDKDDYSTMVKVNARGIFEMPCRVCGKAGPNGWHCGTITCEACKKFFLRYDELGDKETGTCTRQQQPSTSADAAAPFCVITPNTRTSCPNCRFKKCKQLGKPMKGITHHDLISSFLGMS